MAKTVTRQLTRQDLVAARIRKTEDVPTPELGEGTFLRVRGMKTGEQAAIAEFMDRNPNASGTTVGINGFRIMFWRCVVDESGEPMFGEDDSDIADEFDFELVQRVCAAVMRLSGLAEDEGDVTTGKLVALPTENASSTA
ncbi:MAG TPA: hypothetical protein PK691_04520 [Thermomicrobiales bacterium]|nr:hypothetical protein [Thermomicrobiales bacterium]